MRVLLVLFLFLPLGIFAQSALSAGSEDNSVHLMAQQMPKFNGDIMAYLGDHLSYPKSASKQGTVVVSFVIEKDGSVSTVKVIQSVEHALDSAAMACVAAMPKWIPGSQNGTLLRVQYNLPINYSQPVIENSSKNPDIAPRVK
jgi:TonB family protein